MNTITQIHIKYLRPSRTIETVRVINGGRTKLFYIYNYEGNHFRVFENEEQLKLFLNSSYEPSHSFTEELDLDDFLQKHPLE